MAWDEWRSTTVPREPGTKESRGSEAGPRMQHSGGRTSGQPILSSLQGTARLPQDGMAVAGRWGDWCWCCLCASALCLFTYHLWTTPLLQCVNIPQDAESPFKSCWPGVSCLAAVFGYLSGLLPQIWDSQGQGVEHTFSDLGSYSEAPSHIRTPQTWDLPSCGHYS